MSKNGRATEQQPLRGFFDAYACRTPVVLYALCYLRSALPLFITLWKQGHTNF
jgi:hypothetical protein